MRALAGLACGLTDGSIDLPGGEIYATRRWRVEHALAPLGVGTLILKPLRHCLHLWDLTPEEASECGPIMAAAGAVKELVLPDQVYSCLWSHAEWKPVHIHFVLQPSWNRLAEQHKRPGPFLQADLFAANEMPERAEVERFSARARRSAANGPQLGPRPPSAVPYP